MRFKTDLMAVIFICLLPILALGAGSGVTQTMSGAGPGVVIVNLDWIADDTDGSVPSTDLDAVVMKQIDGCYLYLMETDPGSTAPTTLYDIALNDANGLDVLGGAGADRSATATERVMPVLGTDIVPIPIDGTLTFALTNNSVNSATGLVKLYFVR